ncbi:MAG: DUF4147 domain-containing protein, partial [Anaerolineales bacterium]
MPKPNFLDHRHHIESIYIQALQAVDPYLLINKAIHASETQWGLSRETQKRNPRSSLYLIALGKAAVPMTRAVLEFPELQPEAVVIAIPDSGEPYFPGSLRVFHAGHPHPTEASIAAGRAARDMLERCNPDDVVLVLISGGGSALFELPRAGIELDDLHALTEHLLRSGLPIQQLNIIRSALSQTKAGGLARLAFPARVISLILSDVVGDPLASIASGPTVLGPDYRQQARVLLKNAGLWPRLPARIRTVLDQGGSPRPRTRRPVNILLGGNRQFIDGSRGAAEALGYQTEILSRQMHGEARQAGSRFARRLRNRRTRVEVPTCFILGGETTVTVTGTGKGGRNQEFALAAAVEIDGLDGLVVVSFASDGTDGPTDAAGA